jgi:hypothetical protein
MFLQAVGAYSGVIPPPAESRTPGTPPKAALKTGPSAPDQQDASRSIEQPLGPGVEPGGEKKGLGRGAVAAIAVVCGVALLAAVMISLMVWHGRRKSGAPESSRVRTPSPPPGTHAVIGWAARMAQGMA